MKHLLNNLTEQEKNAIREQHTGGIKLNTEKFSKLVESKLGDVKTLISEQTTAPFTVGQKLTGERSTDKQKYTLEVVSVNGNVVVVKITGPGMYEGQKLDGKYPKELTFQDGKLSGNMAMGQFTIIK